MIEHLSAQRKNASQQKKKKNPADLQPSGPSDKMRLQHHIWTIEICLNAITGSWIFATTTEKTVK